MSRQRISRQARWPSERVTIEGRASEFVLVGDEGSAATFRFCPTCGATVYYDNDHMPGFVAGLELEVID